jgi:predicted nucleic acid-binding protein
MQASPEALAPVRCHETRSAIVAMQLHWAHPHNPSMPKVKKKIIIVDTNCYIWLYCSPVRPIMGHEFGGYQLFTITELKLETDLNSDVIARNPWMANVDIQTELASACLKLREPKKSNIANVANTTRKVGNLLLQKYCKAQNTERLRTLSSADCAALATADVLDVCLATDEWPLRLVAESVGVTLFTSVGILRLMESAGSLTIETRIETVRSWCLTNEALHRDWKTEYREFFGDEPPDAQSAKSQSA